MKIHSPGSKVTIIRPTDDNLKELLIGFIHSVCISKNFVEYEVRYWDGCQAKLEWFQDYEVKSQDKQYQQIGFHV